MKNITAIYGLIILIPLTLSIGCSFCSTYTYYPMQAGIERYFHVFKPGNWWVYVNQTGTKRDSMYVSNYSSITTKKNIGCKEYELRNFELNSKYFSSDSFRFNLLSLNSSYGSTAGGQDIGNNNSGNFRLFSFVNQGDTSVGDIGGNNSILELHNYKIGLNYYKMVLEINPISSYLQNSSAGPSILARDLGFVRYVSNNGNDTFSLLKYNIQ